MSGASLLPYKQQLRYQMSGSFRRPFKNVRRLVCAFCSKTLICFYVCVHSRSSQETTPDFFQSIHRCRQVSLLRGPRLYISLARCNFSISLSLFGYYFVSNGTQSGECSGSLCFSLSLSARSKATFADLLETSHIICMSVCAACFFFEEKKS